MLINSEEINNILKISGELVTVAGKKYFEHDKVSINYFKKISDDTYIAKVNIEGTHLYDVKLIKKNKQLHYNCNCPYSKRAKTPCKHIIATFFDIYVNENKYLNFEKKDEFTEIQKSNKQLVYEENFLENIKKSRLINYYEDLELNLNKTDKDIELVPILELPFKPSYLIVNFKIGKDRLYILKDLYGFVINLRMQNKFKYGSKLEFKHNINVFNESSKSMVKFVEKKVLELKSYESLSYYFKMPKEYNNKIKLSYSSLDEFFDLMIDKNIEIQDYEYASNIKCVNEDPILSFEAQKIDSGFIVNKLDSYYVFKGQDYVYILFKDKLYRCSEEYNIKLTPFLKEFDIKSRGFLEIKESEVTSFCEYLVPNLKKFSNLKIDDKQIQKYRAKNLGVKIFLDINNMGNIVANVKFCYDDFEFNPFDIKSSAKYNRNLLTELKTKEVFTECNFVIDYNNKLMYIKNNDHIYKFLTEDINLFMDKFEVLVTEKLKNKKIINSKVINIGIRIQNNLLNINIDDLDLSESELKEIFKRYNLSKKYFRLKDGNYINLDSYGIKTLKNLSSNLGISEKDILKGDINLPKYRAIHIDNVIEDGENVSVKKDKSFKNIVRDIKEAKDIDFEIPKNIESILRPYQKIGFNWIKTLEKYGLGGILADDMGLGKTIQIIAILLDEKKASNTASIVVCPSSLYINWQREINRFAPTLDVLIISGDANKRTELIDDIKKYDVILTSYDLLKRDIEKYDKYNFKYIIADEAQYIKNNNTKNAKSIKNLKGQVRIALTGTPMENSLFELWSIFDFVMPGYLFSYKTFKNKFENFIIKENNKDVMDKLRKMVEPFILRRIKKDVLKELPDKTETVMYNKMDEIQEKVYNAYLLKAKQAMNAEIKENGFEKSRIKILSTITRLRQICCHPSLFLDNYDGKSAKLKQCIEIIEEAIRGQHKILLFSQFTSMFNIIIEELEKRNITYNILTGKTKIDTRIEMVEEFNKNKDISVFLISLKAGGTGLNLTGADMVIHYDPWWNLSAENQATDRAHRIGQKSNVQVFKLITSNSIEEKIQILQNKKMDLTNSVIKEGEIFINKMSNDEILELFEN
jgi:SNF2 family DNA or RNA helicase